jgi:hypothetical protein
MSKAISREELMEIMQAIIEANKQAGREVSMIQLFEGDKEEILLDNRDVNSIN